MAIPMNRFTVAVANFCDSGAVVLNGNTTATSVARPMIHPKKVSGRGVVSSRNMQERRRDQSHACAGKHHDRRICVAICAGAGREDRDVEEPPESEDAE